MFVSILNAVTARRLCLCLRATLLLVLLAPARGDETSDKLVESAIRATTPGDVAKSYKALFNHVKDEDLASLRSAANDSIAMRATWEGVLRECARNPKAVKRNLDRQETYQFLGFVEGRIRATAPQWWGATLLKGQVDSKETPWFETESEHLGIYRRNRFDIRCQEGTSVELDGDRVKMAVGKAQVTISKKDFDAVDDGIIDEVDLTFVDDACYVAKHCDGAYSFVLARVNTSGGAIRWKSTVWNTGCEHSNGYSYHQVAVVADRDRVIVFGRGSNFLYVEGFKASTGENLFRFCTAYFAEF